jgi:hypothetical protein
VTGFADIHHTIDEALRVLKAQPASVQYRIMDAVGDLRRAKHLTSNAAAIIEREIQRQDGASHG